MVNYQETLEKGSFWWKDILNLLDTFESLSKVDVQNSQTCLFWQDNWMQQPLKLDYPELYSFAKNRWISVHTVYHQQSIHDLFNLPLST